jgi:hypothetical protein
VAAGVTWLWWAPLCAATLHIVEEFVYPGGFADWDREYRPSIKGSITPRLHVVVNALLLAACATVGIAGMPGASIEVAGIRWRSAIPAALAVPGWLVLAALLASNAVFHIAGTRGTKRLSPGVRTGVLLYLPLALFGYWHFLGTGQVSPVAAAVSAALGASYHLWASWAHRWRSRGGAANR